MGCISSKVIARTLSLHEDRRKGTQRTKSNSGFPLLEDIIKSARSSSDQYFELVLPSTSFGSNALSKLTISDGTDSSEITVNLEMSTSVEEDNEEGNQKIVTDDDQIETSESCQLILPEHVLSSLVQENSPGVEDKYQLADEFWLSSAGFISKAEKSEFNSQLDPNIIKGNKCDLNSKDDLGSRSFHTVEEYDDLVRKLMLSKSIWLTEKDYACSSGTTIDDIEDKDSAIKDIMQAKTIVTSEKHDVSNEKGYKRNVIAKRLGSLRIPHVANIYSPGSYVTPKFGSYYSFVDAGSEGNSSIFSPELVTELEQSMQKLEEEEESILKEMESSEENGPSRESSIVVAHE